MGCETVEIGTNHLIQWEKEEHVYKAIILALGKYVCHCVKVSIDTWLFVITCSTYDLILETKAEMIHKEVVKLIGDNVSH